MPELPAVWANRSATAAATHRPLPVAWDGYAVEWGRWVPFAPTFVCDRTRRTVPAPERCAGCGALWQPAHAFGSFKRPQDPWPMKHLIASRCPECGHDTVWSWIDDAAWELDPGDYGPNGSIEDGGRHA